MTIGALRFGWTPAHTRACRMGELAGLFEATVPDDLWRSVPTRADLVGFYARKVTA